MDMQKLRGSIICRDICIRELWTENNNFSEVQVRKMNQKSNNPASKTYWLADLIRSIQQATETDELEHNFEQILNAVSGACVGT